MSANLRGLLGVPGLEGLGSGPPFVRWVRGSAPFGIGNRSGQRSVGKRNESCNIRNTTPIYDANNNKGKAKYVRFILDDISPRAHLTMGKGHPVFAIKLWARPRDGTQSPFHPF